MQHLMHAKFTELKERLAGEEGATAVEYGVMVAAIIAVIVVLVFAIGGSVSEAFDTVNTQLT